MYDIYFGIYYGYYRVAKKLADIGPEYSAYFFLSGTTFTNLISLAILMEVFLFHSRGFVIESMRATHGLNWGVLSLIVNGIILMRKGKYKEIIKQYDERPEFLMKSVGILILYWIATIVFVLAVIWIV